MVIIGMMMAVGTVAFTAPEKNNALPTYWFLIDAQGNPSTLVSSPPGNCPKLSEPDCAREYNDADTEVINGIRQVKDGLEDQFIDYASKPLN